MQFIQPIITVLFFVFAGLLLFLAVSIIRDNTHNRLNRVTGLLLFFAAMGPIFLAFRAIVSPIVSASEPFQESVIYNMYYIWEIFFPAFLLFSWVYPIDRLPKMRRPRLRYIIFLPYIFHIFLALIFRNPEKLINFLDIQPGEGFSSIILEPISVILKWLILAFTLILSSEEILFAIINIIYVGLGIYFLNRGRATLTVPQLKNDSRMMTLGLSIAVGLFGIGIFAPKILSIELSENLANLIILAVLFIGIGAIIWSIIRQQFLEVTVLVRQSLVYTVTSGILVGIYILFVGQIDKIITSMLGERTSIVNIAFIVLALICFQPINERLDNLIKRLFIRSRTDYRNIMEQLSRQLITVLEPEEQLEMIDSTMKKAIMISQIYFILYDDKLEDYVLRASEDYPKEFVINRKDLFLGGVGQQNRPTTFDRLTIYGENSDLYEMMKERRIQLILPLKDGKHLLGFLALSHKTSGYNYNAEDISMLGVISNQLVTVITNARLNLESKERQRLEEEIAMARQIQIDLLPKSAPKPDRHSISAFSLPSRTIGGDFYDFIPISDGRFGMVIADASGKGMQAALIVTQIQAMLRSEISSQHEISTMIGNINRNVTALTSSEKYATLFYADYNSHTGELHYTNAGHNYPILVRADGSHEFLSQGGMVIGAFKDAKYQQERIKINKGDMLFMYTDGLSEAQDDKSAEFSEYGEQRIIDFVTKKRTLSSQELIDEILKDVREFDPVDPPRDDTTIIVMKSLED
ncbi:MAG: SpoIIE family protein phosphatase [Candidatus Zixiibacteriota bacterium]